MDSFSFKPTLEITATKDNTRQTRKNKEKMDWTEKIKKQKTQQATSYIPTHIKLNVNGLKMKSQNVELIRLINKYAAYKSELQISIYNQVNRQKTV